MPDPVKGISGLKPTGKLPSGLSPEQKKEWNAFVDFIKSKGLQGSPELDKRDKKLAESLMTEFAKSNPKSGLTLSLVGTIQSELIKANEIARKITGQGMASSSANLPEQLSKVDDWAGSITTRTYFPTATTSDHAGKVIKDYGFDLESYYNDLMKNVKK